MKSKKNRARRWKIAFIVPAASIFLFITTVYVILYNYDLNGLKPRLSRLVKNATGRELIISGDIHLKVSLVPRLIISDIAFQNAAWGSRQNMITAKRLKMQVALLPLLFRNIIVEQLILTEPDILLEVGPQGETNFAFQNQSPSPAENPKGKNGNWPVFGSKKIVIENGRFTYHNFQNNVTHTADLKRLSLSGRDIHEPVDLKLRGLYNDQIITADGTVGPLTALSDPDERTTIDILIKTGGNALSLTGGIRDVASIKGIRFDFSAAIYNPVSFQKLTRRAFPVTIPFKFSGTFMQSGPAAFRVSEFSFTSNVLSVNGGIEIIATGKKPWIKANLAAYSVDLDAILPESPDAPKQKTKKKPRVFSVEPFPALDLQIIDAEIMLQAAAVRFQDKTFQDLTTYMELKNGRLRFDDFKTTVDSGMLTGYLHFYPAGNTWSVDTALKGEHLPLDLLITAKSATGKPKGVVDLFLSVKGTGQSAADLVADLEGDFGFSLAGGSIDTKYIDFLGADFTASLLKIINPYRKRTDHTEINCFVCILDIHNAKAETEALALDTARTLTFGNGHVDLNTEKLDISLKSLPKQGLGIDNIGKISISLSELSKPFKIGGSLSNPKLTLDITQTALTLTKVAGGIALLGPAGAALALITGRFGDDNPCLAAIEAVRGGTKEGGLNYQEEEGIIKKTANNIADRLTNLIGKAIK